MDQSENLESLSGLSPRADDDSVRACAQAIVNSYGAEAVNVIMRWQHEASNERSDSDDAALVALRVINAIWDLEDENSAE